ncbi:MAG TPA: TonB family protein [Rudaea sp.]|nr:TonB family protein [Rudaea sp.]
MAANVQDSTFCTRRGVVAAAIILLHVLAAWGFASGLATRAIQALAPPIEADIVEEVKKNDEPPPPPPPEMERPPVEVPPPEVAIDMPMETNTTAIQDVTDKPPPPAPPPPPRAAGTPAKMTRPVNPDDYYPPGSIRREEQGSPVVQACVGPKGQLLRDPVVTDTSGFPDLDGAAIKVAKATRYAPGTDGGTALPESCIKFKVKFVLKNN